MNARSSTQTRYTIDTESNLPAGAETGEAGVEAGESGVDAEVSLPLTEVGMEVSDPADHEIMRSDASATGPSEGAGDEAGDESTAEAADTETSFETDTEWSPDDRFPQPTEATGEEATLDAYFAEAADNPEDAKEFFPILAALLPVFKAAIPLVVGAFAQRGAAAVGNEAGWKGRAGRIAAAVAAAAASTAYSAVAGTTTGHPEPP
jgi:hypothetical protein